MVCRQAFMRIHGITSGRVQHIAYYAQNSPTPPIDKRGKHANPRATTEEVKQQIHQHIMSFPTIESHYGREKSTKGRKFLSSHLSVAQMHELYLESYEPEIHAKLKRGESAQPLVKYEYYLEYFNTNFNFSFGLPKSDTCATCDELNVKISDSANSEEKHKYQDQKQKHLRESQQFYTELRTSTAMAKENDNIACVSFDFEQNLPLPHIPTNDIFYLRQLWLYVFGIHECGKNLGSMYAWPESVASRGANEVVSCLDHYFKSLEGINTLMLFSDSCGGQNKNSIVMHFLFSLIQLGRFRHIQHFFPVRGHSFLPSDRDFAKTEGKKRKVERIYIPEQWYDVIHSAKKSKPFTVVSVTREMIYDYQSHFSKFLKKTVTKKGEKMKIQGGMLFEYSCEHPKEVWIKYSLFEENWHKFALEKKGVPKVTFPSELAYSGPLMLNSAKVDDLKKIVYKFVPRDCRSFYDAIISENTVESTSSQTDTPSD